MLLKNLLNGFSIEILDFVLYKVCCSKSSKMVKNEYKSEVLNKTLKLERFSLFPQLIIWIEMKFEACIIILCTMYYNIPTSRLVLNLEVTKKNYGK